MKTHHTVSLYVEVHDLQALHQAAVSNYIDENSQSETVAEDAEELLGTAECPRVHACLTQLFDPGTSPSGTSIIGSSAE